MTNLDAINLGSFINTDKVVEIVEGSFTYTRTTADGGGIYEVNNPQPGNQFLPFTTFSTDGGVSWFGDLDGDYQANVPDLLTCATLDKIRYRWHSYGPTPSMTVLFKTALLSTEV